MNVPFYAAQVITAALQEDLGTGDVTSNLLLPEDQVSTAMIIAKGGFILAGLPFAREVFRQVDPEVEFRLMAEDGQRVKKGTVVARVSGRTRSLLAGERVALNMLQHLSGVATLTNKFMTTIKGLKARIADTRKTLPGLRYFEKYAVRMGGGANHRFGLYDAILIKDNHIEAVGSLKKAVELARKGMHLMKVEVEVENLKEFKAALEAGADVIMLDNMGLADMAEAVRLNNGRALLEASGNVTLETVRQIAETGVDLISTGSITHSAPAADLSMKIVD